MYIVAAPVGAVPKRSYVLDEKFLSDAQIAELERHHRIDDLPNRLKENGWERVPDGGIEARFSAPGCRSILSRKMFELLPKQLEHSLLATLTSQGWTSTGDGQLVWMWGTKGGASYLPPDLVLALTEQPQVLDDFLVSGWQRQTAGWWFFGKGFTPYLSILPEEIISEALACCVSGAAVVHLHTRKIGDEEIIRFPDGGVAARFSRQDNLIDEAQYDQIVPGISNRIPEVILNVSTSVRGGKSDFDSPLRRAHLKLYGSVHRIPEIASFSPGAVRFRQGGGYENPPLFLEDQVEHFLQLGIRPEVEVFNRTILDNATGFYRRMLLRCGAPVMFMLVAGVDQVAGEEGAVSRDDSLIKPEVRIQALTLVQTGLPEEIKRATFLIVNALRPVVKKIRAAVAESLISLLLPGPLQTLVVDVAVALDIDGVRVGLEDSLTILDNSFRGGLRKAIGSHEQVRFAANRLRLYGMRVMSAQEYRIAFLSNTKPYHWDKAHI